MLAIFGLSEGEGAALIAAVGSGATGILVLVITQLTNLANAKSERRSRSEDRQAELEAREREQQAERVEWYRRLLFERRLQAANEGYRWALLINNLVNHVVVSKHEDKESADALAKASQEGREWYNANAMYLIDGLPGSSHFIGIFNQAMDVAHGDSHFDWQGHNEVLKFLRERVSELMAEAEDADERKHRS